MYIKSGINLFLKRKSLLNSVSKEVADNQNCSVFKAKLKILYNSFLFGCTYSEYAMFDFYNRTSANKKTFATTLWLLKAIKKFNPVQYREFFHDKVKFNEKFKSFLGRDYLVLSKASESEIKSFLIKYPRVVLKGGHGCSGKQVEVMESDDTEILDMIHSGKYDLVEQFVENHEDMAKLNPTSLNTLRIVTVHSDKSFNLIFTGVRIGAEGALIDNVSQGGCCASIDKNTGKISSTFVSDVTCEREGTQKDRNEIGYQIPMWKETLEMIRNAAEIVPEIHIVGWDAAITPDGPILVEGNESFGAYIMQYYAKLNEPGLKKEMLDAMAKI